MEYMENLTEYVEKQASLCQQHDVIDKELYARYGVKEDCVMRMDREF